LSLTSLQIDILLQNDHSDERELIKGIELERDKFQNVKVAPIVRRIAEMGFPVKENLISYFSISENAFVFVGKDPIEEQHTIPSDDIVENQRLVIKCRPQSNISPSV
jgi:hypothetical protein